MNQPPPRSTLFPYTTLFRSALHEEEVQVAHRHAEGGGDAARRQVGIGEVRVDVPKRPIALQRARRVGGALALAAEEDGGHEDRKSTRLNSSHSQISYAVFCL